MSENKLVNSTQLDADLIDIANAIRTKGGTSEQLAFPVGFVSAIEALPKGKYTDTQWLVKTVDGPVYYTGTSIPTLDGFQKVTEFSAPNWVNGFGANFLFRNCYLLEKVSLPKVTRFTGTDKFKNCRKLQMLVLPSLGKGASASNSMQAILDGFNSCSILQVIDVYAPYSFPSKSFLNCTVLDTLIIRNRSNASSAKPIASLAAIDAFSGTPFASDGAGGTLYVPSADISAYQEATNWSAILGYENNQILPIEGSIYETQWADGTPIT